MSKAETVEASQPTAETQYESINQSSWVTDSAWVSGIFGAVVLMLIAAWYHYAQILKEGLTVFGFELASGRLGVSIAALFMVAFSMVVCELLRLWLREGKHFIKVSPEMKDRQYGLLIRQSIVIYIKNIILFLFVIKVYQIAGEYGFSRSKAKYIPWFEVMDILWQIYLWVGLPYTVLTRAFKHNPEADQKDLATLVGNVLRYTLSFLPLLDVQRKALGQNDKKAALGLLVKFFFAPLMTIFFCSQFPHVVSNVGYLFGEGGLAKLIASGSYTHTRFNNDFFNISVAFIFGIDVALAWCGYVVSSRWVDNQTISAEPTLLGWLVCICCYPPFQMFLGLYVAAPGEREVLRFANQYLITLFTGMMVASYFVYMTATLWFGVRFSNLTHRGIIRKGPFAFVRHPAYASKNFAWWCVMFPAIIYNAQNTGIKVALLQTAGLVLMTWVYYMRSLTEERHLSADPYYRAYCKQVKYRFIPGLI